MLFEKNKKFNLKDYFKQIILGLLVFLICKYLPNNKLKLSELLLISLTISITYRILDKICPSQKIYI